MDERESPQWKPSIALPRAGHLRPDREVTWLTMRVLYLEFGVFDGRATHVTGQKLLRHPESHLHGFDSFEGLPESWAGMDRGKGYFSTNGVIPQIDDARVRFFKGLVFKITLLNLQGPAARCIDYQLRRRLRIRLPLTSFPNCAISSFQELTSTSMSSIIDSMKCRRRSMSSGSRNGNKVFTRRRYEDTGIRCVSQPCHGALDSWRDRLFCQPY